MKYFVKRSVAYMIDCMISYAVIMIVLQWAILSQFREQLGITDEWFRESLHMELYVLLTISLPVWFYFAYMDSNRTKGTFGKRIMKLSVLNLKQERIPLRNSIFRTCLKLLPWEIAHAGVIFPTPLYFAEEGNIRFLTIVGILLFIIYVLSILINAKRQSVYDQLLGTVVLEKPSY